MKGTKRFAMSDSNPETNDAAFRNKRIMAGSPFDGYRAEPSQQPSMTPALDIHRAESSRKHVRALNIQFASWVQTQLKNHPDELWEDGVQDYLAHASNVMEKFSDVVNWLKANAAKGVNLPAVGSFAAEKKLLTENNNNETKLSQEKTTFNPLASTTSFASPWSSRVFSNSQPPMASTTSFASPWSSGVFSNSQPPIASTTSFASPWSSGVFSNSQLPTVSTKSSGVFSNSQPPVLFGSQSLAPAPAPTPTNRDASADVDGENDVEQTSSPSVKKSEEKGIIVVHEVKCKLYVKSSDGSDKDTWKDKGTGQLSIKCKEGVSKGTKESKPTVVVRNDVGKVLLNALLYPGIKTNTQKNSVVAIFHTSGDNGGNDGGNSGSVVARTFLLRTKTEEDRNKLATAIQEYAPAS